METKEHNGYKFIEIHTPNGFFKYYWKFGTLDIEKVKKSYFELTGEQLENKSLVVN